MRRGSHLFRLLAGLALSACGAPPPVVEVPLAPPPQAPPAPAPVRVLAPGTLRVETDPSGALVAVDGRSFGVSPIEIELPAGRHVLVFAFGRERFPAHPVDVPSGERSVVHVPLVPPTEAPRPRTTAGAAARLDAAFDATRPALLGCLKEYHGTRVGDYAVSLRIRVVQEDVTMELLRPEDTPIGVLRCMWDHLEQVEVRGHEGEWSQVHEVRYTVQ